MAESSWQVEVAQLLEYCAKSLRIKNDRQAVVALGTAIAYLQRAQERGERTARDLLLQFDEAGGDGGTQRFTFAPGELEELTSRSRDK